MGTSKSLCPIDGLFIGGIEGAVSNDPPTGAGYALEINGIKNYFGAPTATWLSGGSLNGHYSLWGVPISAGDLIRYTADFPPSPGYHAAFGGAIFWPWGTPVLKSVASATITSGPGGTMFSPIFWDGPANSLEESSLSVMPCPVSITSLMIRVDQAIGTGKSLSVTLRLNGSDTTLTGIISGAYQTMGADLSHGVSFGEFDLASLKINTSGWTYDGRTIYIGLATQGITAGGSQNGTSYIKARSDKTISGRATILGVSSKSKSLTGRANVMRPPAASLDGRSHIAAEILAAGSGWSNPWFVRDAV